MLRWIFALAFVGVLLAANVASADAVTLRIRIEAHGAMVTLGDVFEGSGALAPPPDADWQLAPDRGEKTWSLTSSTIHTYVVSGFSRTARPRFERSTVRLKPDTTYS